VASDRARLDPVLRRKPSDSPRVIHEGAIRNVHRLAHLDIPGTEAPSVADGIRCDIHGKSGREHVLAFRRLHRTAIMGCGEAANNSTMTSEPPGSSVRARVAFDSSVTPRTWAVVAPAPPNPSLDILVTPPYPLEGVCIPSGSRDLSLSPPLH
jgi:hypothetical protein